MSMAKLMKVSRISGKIQVGRCAIDSNVGLGLKIAPKIRPIELTDGAASGEGGTGLAMFFSSGCQGWKRLVPSSSTLERNEKLQAGRVYSNSCALGSVVAVERAVGVCPRGAEQKAVTSRRNLRHGSD